MEVGSGERRVATAVVIVAACTTVSSLRGTEAEAGTLGAPGAYSALLSLLSSPWRTLPERGLGRDSQLAGGPRT